ncbi:MAG TPA: universal stress protein [Solirubrobacteraceae bacterium]|nr:universal stress protein [Solirubrobacteraceae bacterium]
MFQNVLVGVDGGANGRDAIALARMLADPEAKLTLAHVRPGLLHPLHAITPALIEEERKASHELLEHERAAAQLTAELVSVVSSTHARGLHEQAEEQGAELLVVGSSSRGPFRRAMLEDDTRASLNGAPCAVAVSAVGLAAPSSGTLTIGVGYDGSDESRTALAAARALAERLGASLRAMQVVGLPTFAFGIVPPITGDGVEELLAEATAELEKLDGLEGRAVYGLVGEELASFGDELDLLVVGSRGYGPVQRLVLGSTSNYLQRHARCSLLVLPRGGRE